MKDLCVPLFVGALPMLSVADCDSSEYFWRQVVEEEEGLSHIGAGTSHPITPFMNPVRRS